MILNRCVALCVVVTVLGTQRASGQVTAPSLLPGRALSPAPSPLPPALPLQTHLFAGAQPDPFVQKMEEHVQRWSAMSDEETKAYLRATAFFDTALQHETRTVLLGFLKQYPKSRKAADILYRLATLSFLADNEAEAMQYLEQLLLDHYPSTWARLALKSHFREDTFFRMATNIRDKALVSKCNEHDLAVSDLFSNATLRFKNSPELVREATYKLHDYLLSRHGDFPGSREELAKLAATKDDDCRWVKLARIRLADADKIPAMLDQLGKMERVDGEVSRLIMELAQRNRDKLKGEDSLRARFLRAQALLGSGKQDEGLSELSTLVKEHPKSSWAGEAMFWLAEHAYAQAHARPTGTGIVQVRAVEKPQPLRAAQTLYRRLAKEHSTHPRALKAAEWANHIDRQEEVMRELENVLLRSYSAVQKHFSLSARLTTQRDGKEGCSITLAWRDPRHYRLDMIHEKTGMSLVTNPRGTWYWDRAGPIRHAKEALDLPMPVISITADEHRFLVGVGMDPARKAPGLRVNAPEDAAHQLVQRIAETSHLSSQAYAHKNKKHRRIVLETADARSPTPTRIELMLDETGALEGMRMTWRDPEDADCTLTLDQLVIGGDVPESLFAPPEQAGAPAVEVDKINPFILAGQVMQIYTEIGHAMSALRGK